MLTESKIKNLKTYGKEQRFPDVFGLHLRVNKYGNKTWQLRYLCNRKRKWFGLVLILTST